MTTPLTRTFLRALYYIAERVPTRRGRIRAREAVTSLRRRLHRGGAREFREVTISPGLRLTVNIAEAMGGDLYYAGGFETAELTIFAKLAREGDTVFDVGANAGVYSLVASRRIGPRGAVHAFEPIAEVFSLLCRNLERNAASNVTANHLAVEERSGTVRIQINRDSALTSLGSTGRGEIVGTEEVGATSLDEYSEVHGIERINLLKADVEGFEGHVLRGARRLLESSPDLAILCELAEKNFRPLGFSVSEVLLWMEGLGFKIWEVDQVSGRLEPFRRRSTYLNQNFFFARAETDRAALLESIARRSVG